MPYSINVMKTYSFSSMENLDHMFKLGLYINDLSIHDSSRELVLAGTQQSAELKLLLDQVSSSPQEVVSSNHLNDEKLCNNFSHLQEFHNNMACQQQSHNAIYVRFLIITHSTSYVIEIKYSYLRSSKN